MRTPPQIIIRAADGRPVELQDLLVADARFKILVFTGKPEGNDVLAAAAQSLESTLNAVYGDKYQDVVDIITICVGSAMEMEYNIVPAVLRSHWTK
jgi:phenol 2-monooxygenase